MYETGYAYGFGLGVSVDPEVALDWLERADAIGHAEAASLSRLLRVRGGP